MEKRFKIPRRKATIKVTIEPLSKSINISTVYATASKETPGQFTPFEYFTFGDQEIDLLELSKIIKDSIANRLKEMGEEREIITKSLVTRFVVE